MKKISFLIVLIAIATASYMWWPEVKPVEQTGKLMSVESYVSQSISELSPVKEQLGGKFYVTDIQIADGKGTVSYEDGHSAYTADFTYSSSDRTGHTISSFVIRD